MDARNDQAARKLGNEHAKKKPTHTLRDTRDTLVLVYRRVLKGYPRGPCCMGVWSLLLIFMIIFNLTLDGFLLYDYMSEIKEMDLRQNDCPYEITAMRCESLSGEPSCNQIRKTPGKAGTLRVYRRLLKPYQQWCNCEEQVPDILEAGDCDPCASVSLIYHEDKPPSAPKPKEDSNDEHDHDGHDHEHDKLVATEPPTETTIKRDTTQSEPKTNTETTVQP